MTAAYTNTSGISLSLAVWLVSDYYDYERKGISATGLLKPIKQTILARRVAQNIQVGDVTSMIQNRMGAALHDSIEKAWTTNHAKALSLLGFAPGVIKRVKINPDPKDLNPGDIPVYLEIRKDREVLGVKVSGQFDFVADGQVEDFKSTGTYTYIAGNKDQDYILQGSIYRWIHPEIITKDTMKINFIFTDWQKAMARQQPDKYPQSRIISNTYTLMSLAQTEAWVTKRVQQLIDLIDADEQDLPPCTDKELWRSDPVYKYYKKPENATKQGARSTKNFDSLAEAMERKAEDGGVGVVKTVPGEVKACHYCPAFSECRQKDALIASGDLVL